VAQIRAAAAVEFNRFGRNISLKVVFENAIYRILGHFDPRRYRRRCCGNTRRYDRVEAKKYSSLRKYLV
jgi:hypothetical protein